MEGLNKRSGGNAIYVKIFNGDIVRRVKEPIAGETRSREIEDKETHEKRTIHEIEYGNITGRLVKVEWKQTKFGKVWEITVKAGSNNIILSISKSGRLAQSFLSRIRNCDLSKPIMIDPFLGKNRNTGKPQDVLLVKQQINNSSGFETVPSYYAREDVPQMVQKEFRGDLVWDDTELMQFLETNVVDNWLTPQLQHIHESKIEAVAAEETAQPEKVTVETARGIEVVDDADDLPF